jgi:hypothetical protein
VKSPPGTSRKSRISPKDLFMDTPQPPHQLGALTTSELTRYLCQLEHAIDGIAAGAAIQADLRRKLGEVLAEQQSRASIAASIARTDP